MDRWMGKIGNIGNIGKTAWKGKKRRYRLLQGIRLSVKVAIVTFYPHARESRNELIAPTIRIRRLEKGAINRAYLTSYLERGRPTHT